MSRTALLIAAALAVFLTYGAVVYVAHDAPPSARLLPLSEF